MNNNGRHWASVLFSRVVSVRQFPQFPCYGLKTWDLVNWVTHFADATSYEAYVAHQATERTLTSWSIALMVHGGPERPRCAVCRSYQFHVDYESGEGFGVAQVLVCDKCGWRTDGELVEEEEPEPSPPVQGDCVFVDVPLRPPFKRP